MAKKKILIIDDEKNLCSLMEDMLSNDYEILTATDSHMGIEQAEQSKPDLIFLDLMMPHLPGPETAKHLAQNVQTRSIPIVIMTAKLYEDEYVKTAKQEPNVKGVLIKPCPMATLHKTIREILDNPTRQ